LRNFSLLFITIVFLIIGTSDARAYVSVEAIVPGICGNSVLEVLEQCDGVDLGGATCLNSGYASGTLTCSETCSFVTDQCLAVQPPEDVASATPALRSSGSRRIFPLSSVTLSGYAIPNKTVSVVWGGSGPIETTTDSLGIFNLRVPGLAHGFYTFMPQLKDQNGTVLSQGTVNVKLDGGSVLVSDIILPPTLKAELIGDSMIRFYGYTAPSAEVYLLLKDRNETVYATTAKANGSWSYVLLLEPRRSLTTIGAWSMVSGHYSQLSKLVQVPASWPSPIPPVIAVSSSTVSQPLPLIIPPLSNVVPTTTPNANSVVLVASWPSYFWWLLLGIIILLWYIFIRKRRRS
jgi:hypothetical protein